MGGSLKTYFCFKGGRSCWLARLAKLFNKPMDIPGREGQNSLEHEALLEGVNREPPLGGRGPDDSPTQSLIGTVEDGWLTILC